MGLLIIMYREWALDAVRAASDDIDRAVARFRSSEARVVHLDLHVWEPLERPVPVFEDVSRCEALCKLGVELVKRWQHVVEDIRTTGGLVSRPLLIVDDEWLLESENATPPHIYVCIAKDDASFRPVEFGELKACSDSGIACLDEAVSAEVQLFRVEGTFEDEPSAWLLAL